MQRQLSQNTLTPTLKVLIVEDFAPMRRLLAGLLLEQSAEVFECADGAAALTAYAAHRPDWVLMDIELPGLDGISATRQLKAAWPSANVLIVTGYDEAELRRAAREAGACGYVLKTNLLELWQWLAA